MSTNPNEEAKKIYEIVPDDSPLRQGEILTNVTQIIIDLKSISDELKSVTPIIHPIAIVVSQDCDLDWDFKAKLTVNQENKNFNNKDLPNILICMAITAQELRDRDKDLPKDVTKEINSTSWNEIKKNKHERYYFLQQILKSEDKLRLGLPELGIDFKRYFTVPSPEIYERIKLGEIQRRSKLKTPYLEHFASRFYYFQSRIALPSEHSSE